MGCFLREYAKGFFHAQTPFRQTFMGLRTRDFARCVSPESGITDASSGAHFRSSKRLGAPPRARAPVLRARGRAVAKMLKDVLEAQRIEHAVFRHAALARDRKAPSHQIKLRNRVRVRIDAKHAAK